MVLDAKTGACGGGGRAGASRARCSTSRAGRRDRAPRRRRRRRAPAVRGLGDRLNTWPALAILAALGHRARPEPVRGGLLRLVDLGAGRARAARRADRGADRRAGAPAAARRARARPRSPRSALLALVSALWTDSIEQAVVEGNRLLLYAAALALLVVLLRSDRGAVLAFARVRGGRARRSPAGCSRACCGDDETLFLGGRLHEPLGYINGQASFFVLAFWPCLALAERRGGRFAPALAGLGLAGATLFAGLAVLGQSRGAILAGALSLRRRARAAARPAAADRRAARRAARAWRRRCRRCSTSTATARPPEPARRGRRACCSPPSAAGAIWALLVALERARDARAACARGARSRSASPRSRVAGAVAAASRPPDRIADFADRQYTAFVTLGGAQGEPTASRLASGAGNRYDYWRVAVDAWREHPLAGVGAGGYDKPYFAQRTTSEDIRQPHSLPLQVLAELGIVGALLFAAALLLIAAGAWRRIRDGARAPVVVAAVGRRDRVARAHERRLDAPAAGADRGGAARRGGAAAPAAAATTRRARPARRPALGSPRALARRALAPALLVGVAITVAALSLSRQALSELYVDRAQDALAGDPARALVEANRALRLDREAIAAYYAKAAALARFGEGDAARAVLLDATRREPRNFVTWVLLGDLRCARATCGAARAELPAGGAAEPARPGPRQARRRPAIGAGRCDAMRMLRGGWLGAPACARDRPRPRPRARARRGRAGRSAGRPAARPPAPSTSCRSTGRASRRAPDRAAGPGMGAGRAPPASRRCSARASSPTTSRRRRGRSGAGSGLDHDDRRAPATGRRQHAGVRPGAGRIAGRRRRRPAHDRRRRRRRAGHRRRGGAAVASAICARLTP